MIPGLQGWHSATVVRKTVQFPHLRGYRAQPCRQHWTISPGIYITPRGLVLITHSESRKAVTLMVIFPVAPRGKQTGSEKPNHIKSRTGCRLTGKPGGPTTCGLNPSCAARSYFCKFFYSPSSCLLPCLERNGL